MPPITEEMLVNWFTYHAPKDTDTTDRYAAIRAAGLFMAKVIVQCTPPSADQTAAIRKIREAVMTANAAIACDGK